MPNLPWFTLKEVEHRLTEDIVCAREVSVEDRNLLEALVMECSEDPEADLRICFVGARALLAQINGQFSLALSGRYREAEMIEKLYDLLKENDLKTRAYALQQYEQIDLERRRLIRELLSNLIGDPAKSNQNKIPGQNQAEHTER